MLTDIRCRRLWLVAALSAFAVLFASPAAAEPGEDAGTPASLKEQLDTANRGFLDAQANLANSRQRQAELAQRLVATQAKLDTLNKAAGELAAVAYRNNSMRTASALLASVSPSNFVDRVTAVNAVSARNDKQLREYGRLTKELADTKAAVDAEVTKQEQQLTEMDKRRADAEKALKSVGGGERTTAPSNNNSGASSGSAKPKPAAPAPKVNGKWPPESCSIDDPTTGGCLTPRTLHALQQAKNAGFTRYVSCYRGGGSGEHPKGRACDFAAQPNGFGGVATGGDYTYGTNLANYYIDNAGNLAVLYVIWFKKIWQPSTGWRTYNGGNGDPASDHTNHVHLSVN